MIQNPSVAGSGGNVENVSVDFKYGRASVYCYYSTIENGSIVEKHLDVSGQTISAAKGSIIVAFTTTPYEDVLNVRTGARTIATFYNVPGEDMDISEFPVVSRQTFTVRVYEATG